MENQINNLSKSTIDVSQSTCTSIEEEIYFNSNGVLTLGVEIELQLIDSKNYNLCSRATDVLNATAHLEKIKQEFYLSTIEVTTDKCITAQEIEDDFYKTLASLQLATKDLGVLFSTTGSHPFSKYSDWVVSPTTRYQEKLFVTQKQNQILRLKQ